MKKYIFLMSAFLLVGCGEGTSNETDNLQSTTPTTSITTPKIKYISLNDALLSEQWSILKNNEFYRLNNVNDDAHIHAQNSLKIYSGKGIKVAIIDSGFEIHHPELSSKIIAMYNFNNNTNNIDTIKNKSAHGTAVTGIIAASANEIGIRGIAPNVELILLEMPEYLTDANTIEMFDKAVELGADIINCSWGTGNVSDAVKDYLNELGKSVFIVFASGNESNFMENDESSVEAVFGVGATSAENLRTSYSNFGPELDFVAPGGEVLGVSTLDLLAQEGYSEDEYVRYDELRNGKEVSFIGTSASAPIISAVLALALEKKPSLSVGELRELLKSSVDKVSLNIPYMYDVDTTNTSHPTFSGTLGTNSNTEFKLEILTVNNNAIGLYPISFSGNSTWNSTVTDILEEGEYKARLVNENSVFATDSSFTVNYSESNIASSKNSRNDFYGYGKINTDLLLNNIDLIDN